MDTIEDLLRLSTHQYRELFDKTKEVGTTLTESDAETISSHTRELDDLMTQARHTDSAINQFNKEDVLATCPALFKERLTAMRDFLELNDSLAEAIKAKMAIIQAERTKICAGKRGIGGYQNSVQKPTKFINKSI